MLYVCQTHKGHIQTDVCGLYVLDIQAHKTDIEELLYVCFMCLYDDKSSHIHAHTVMYVVSEYRHITQFVCACIMYVCDLHTYNIEYFFTYYFAYFT
jgi:hypothetical protein